MLAKTPKDSIRARATQLAVGIEAADIASGLSLARAKDRPVIQAMGSASEIGSWQALFALSATALALGMVARDRRLAHAGRNMLTAGLVASLVKTTIKRTVHRTRPNVFMDEGHYARGWPGTGNGPWQSFPSGHAALSVAVARSVARTYPDAAAPAYGAAAAIAAIQVVRGAHFPVDVLAGAVIGVAAEAVSHRPFTDEARRDG